MTVFEELGKLEANKNVIPSDCLTFSEAASYVIEYTDSEYNKLFEAVGIEELAVYESTGSQIIYEEGKLKDLKEKIVNFIKRIWQAIKDFFSKIIGYIMIKGKYAPTLLMIKKEEVEKYVSADKKYGVVSDWKENFEAANKAIAVLEDAPDKAVKEITNIANIQLDSDGAFKDGKDASSLASAANDAVEKCEKIIYNEILGNEVNNIAEFRKAFKAKFVGEKSIEVDKKYLVDNVDTIISNISKKNGLADHTKDFYNNIKKIVDKVIASINDGFKDAKMAMVANYATKAVGNVMKVAQAVSGVFGDIVKKQFTESLILAVRMARAIKVGKDAEQKEKAKGKKEEAPKAEEKAEEKKEEKKEEKTNESVDLTASFIDEAFNW